MKFPAIITAAILGVSSLASAKPFQPAPIERDQVSSFARRPDHRPQRPRWTVLDASNSSRGRGRDVIDVSSRQSFSSLKLEATRGSTLIEKVMITFANGRTQTVELDRRLTPAMPSALIDLQGNDRQIKRIVVVGKGGARATYAVLAS